MRLVSSQWQQFDRWPDNQCLGMQSVGGFAWDQRLLVPKNYRMSVKPINLIMDWPFLSFLISAKSSLSFEFSFSGWWFVCFFLNIIFHFIYGIILDNPSHWLICFRGVGSTTNQFFSGSSGRKSWARIASFPLASAAFPSKLPRTRHGRHVGRTREEVGHPWGHEKTHEMR